MLAVVWLFPCIILWKPHPTVKAALGWRSQHASSLKICRFVSLALKSHFGKRRPTSKLKTLQSSQYFSTDLPSGCESVKLWAETSCIDQCWPDTDLPPAHRSSLSADACLLQPCLRCHTYTANGVAQLAQLILFNVLDWLPSRLQMTF